MKISTVLSRDNHYELKKHVQHIKNVYEQLSPTQLREAILKRKEGVEADSGALVIETGKFTGRSPKDKFIVEDEMTRERVNWNDFNIPISPAHFNKIFETAVEHLEKLDEVWIRNSFAGAKQEYRIGIRTYCSQAFGDLFAYNMLIRPTEEELADFKPDWKVLWLPELNLSKEVCGTRQENAAVINFDKRIVVIAGTAYTGEIKKGVFTILNYLLPMQHNVLSMHCAANMGKDGDTALFFGLSGTGKTTLSADPDRGLIGDDEHGWADDGIFNFEGGCYAKTIDLSEKKEPQIYAAIKEGALLENVKFFEGTNKVDFSNKDITENTRVSYPLHYIPGAVIPSVGKSPENIFFLTCDAFGVLPPISRLSVEQAMYQFISGYTAKVAGTETGITEPKSTFSACFGAPFIPLHPGKYAEMLKERLIKHKTKVWLVNTGWTGGSYGTGSRIKLEYTRALIKAALRGDLDNVQYTNLPLFNLSMPVECPGVPSEILNPENTWEDKAAYREKLSFLAGLFRNNFKKYEEGVEASVIQAGPSEA